MLSLSPTLAPLSNRETPRHLSALPPSVRALPIDLQVIALCDMLADSRRQLAQMAESRGRFADWLSAEQVAHAETRKQLEETISR